MSGNASSFLTPPFKQVALVVSDLDEAVRRWASLLGIGPWTAYRLEPPRLKEMVYHGAEVEFSLRHALVWQGEMQFELVQPLAGPSIFADHLSQHGEGLHHLGKYVTDHPAAVSEALRNGFVPLQSAGGLWRRRRRCFRLLPSARCSDGHRAHLGSAGSDRARIRLPSGC